MLFASLRFSISFVTRALRFAGREIYVDPTTWVPLSCNIKVNQGGSVRIGRHCELHKYSMILSYGGDITIGDHCSINPFTILYGHGGLRIGTGVRIAAHTVVIPADHIAGDENLPLYLRGVSKKGIEIGDYAWIGAGCRILDGVRIGRHAVIGAGSVVTSSIPDNAVAVGSPARVISLSRDSGQSQRV